MGQWVSHLAHDRQWDKGSLTKEKMTGELDWLLLPMGQGWNQKPVTDCCQTKDTGHVCGAAGCCVWALGQTQEP